MSIRPGPEAAIANMDQLDPGRPLLNRDRNSIPEAEAHRDGRTLGGSATVDQGNADRARRTDQRNVVAAVRTLGANHNRARRSAKSAGSLQAAQHRPLGGLALEGLAPERHTDRRQSAGAELVRLGTGGKPLSLAR